ncbi:MAG TPA: PQQ-dependent sugar dehydrogenase [Herpetosiphonaceae bacterium]|nr:PQQ-dependent sugar dehydrogenase [Herpetosiphonaceae bacterium]
MIFIKPRLSLILLLLLISLLAACGGQDASTPDSTSPASAGADSTAEAVEEELTTAAVVAEEAATAVAVDQTAVGVEATGTADAAPASTTEAGTTTTTGPAPRSGPFDPATFTLALTEVTAGLDEPVHVTHAGDGSGRLFVVERGGTIRVVSDAALVPEPFLDITDRVGSRSSEQGLLSVAFHPRYGETGRLFVDYTDKQGDTVISEFRVSDDAGRADPASEKVLLRIDQPAPNHNGGQLAFGPDGYLYIGMGDGGGAGDQFRNGQNRESLLGKILRIDVDNGDPYAIPPDNPYADEAGTRPEIWALGMRNPWRFSFDRETGDLYIGDVGQNSWEELSFQPASSRGGENYGWPITEGTHCFQPREGCDTAGLTLPVHDYAQELGCTIVAGYRYRGTAVPDLAGAFIYADYCSGRMWALTQGSDGSWTNHDLVEAERGISSFGEDENGELYLVNIGGALYRLGAQPR